MVEPAQTTMAEDFHRQTPNLNLNRREWLAAFIAALTIPQFRAFAAPKASGPVTPEQFGAVGDGQTNDTAAFAAMTEYINRRRGGEIALRPTTYIIGKQAPDRRIGYGYAPASVMDFSGCRGPLVIRGNGARIRCADGLRYGTFDRFGQPTQHTMPYYGVGEISSPYFAMINVVNCSGQVAISDLELDGNVAGLLIGGPWGDTGWQIPCSGIKLQNNKAPIQIVNVRSHHHALDGGIGDGLGIPGAAEQVTIQDCEFVSNGRNAWSMVGGIGWAFSGCKFDRSARDLPFPGSAPKAGIDFEAEGGKYVSDISLTDCNAEDNSGVACCHPGAALVSNVSWQGGRITGTRGWSYFGGGNDGIRFSKTLFLGALINLSKETFEECTFSNDVAHSPTGMLYNPSGFIVPDSVTTNRFTRCLIVHSKPELSVNGNFNQALFEDCVFQTQPGAGRLDVFGHFRGSETQFIASPGGTNFLTTPERLGGIYNAGGADDPFSITTQDGVTKTYVPSASS